MRRIKFTYNRGIGYQPIEEIVEFENSDRDEYISDHFDEWLWNYIDAGWEEIETE